jgi:hypothetical protein
MRVEGEMKKIRKLEKQKLTKMLKMMLKEEDSRKKVKDLSKKRQRNY